MGSGSLKKALVAIVLGVAFAAPAIAQDVPIDRTVLPIRQPEYPPVTEPDARNVKALPVSLDYTNPFTFNGKIEKVTIDLKDDKAKAADNDTIEQSRADSTLKRALSN